MYKPAKKAKKAKSYCQDQEPNAVGYKIRRENTTSTSW
jgi:hypothetical protein